MFLVELKTEVGDLSPIQEHWHTRIRKLGGEVYVLHGKTGIITWLRCVVGSRDTRSRKPPKVAAGVR